MPYRTLLLELADDDQDAARLAAALQLAGRFEAALLTAHVAAPPIMPTGLAEGHAYIGPEVLESQREAVETVRARLRARLREVSGAAQVPFLALEGDRGAALATAARGVDLTIVAGRAEGGLGAALASGVEDLIAAAGGPVLVLPPAGASTEIGLRVLIGWNGSREAARATRDALPLLAAASDVALLSLDAEGEDTLAAAGGMLERHGVRAELLRRERGEAGKGEALLAVAAERAADLLVMGAYGHSRLRELMFGGATRDVLKGATLPVLYAC